MENETQNMDEWLKQELEELNANRTEYEELPSLILEEKKVTNFLVDATKPFDKWVDQKNNVVKKIIPVLHDGQRKNFWLNVKNPLYAEMIAKIHNGVTEFKVVRTGNQDDTRYSIVE